MPKKLKSVRKIYTGALYYIAENLGDQGFSQEQLEDIQSSALAIAKKAKQLSKKRKL